MKDDNLPESARRALENYPHLEPSPAFNRAVLESLASARTQRRQTLVGRLEEFLGVGLWQFAGSGALGALLPAVVLGGLLLCGGDKSAAVSRPTMPFFPLNAPLSRSVGLLYARDWELRRALLFS